MALNGLALHTWTLDTTPLSEALRVARETGWDAIELRSIDFDRAVKEGHGPEHVLEQVRASRLPLACLGVRVGWMFAEGPEWEDRRRWFADCCRWARALGGDLLMSPVDFTMGSIGEAATRLRELGDTAREHGVRLALEHQSQAPQLNRLEHVREVLALAGHSSCGVLVDAYHVHRSGDLESLRRLPGEEIFYFQFSDVPADARPGVVLDRLPPGRGVVPWHEVFGILAAKGYRGYLSYEAPNEAAWRRDPGEVAREAREATRALLPQTSR